MSVTLQEALAEYNAKQESERLAMYAGAAIAPAGAALKQVTPSAGDGRYLREEMIRIVAQGVKFDTPEDMIAAAEAVGVYVLLGNSPEQPEQPSTETMAETKRPFPTKMTADGVPYWEELTEKEIEALKADEGTPAPMPVEPLTDLTGVDYAPAFEGYQPNGALPETD